MGWLGKYELLPPGRSKSVAAFRRPCDRKVNRGGKAHMTKVGMLQLQKLKFESQAAAISARPSSQYCNCTKWDKNPIKKIFIKKYYYVKMYYNVEGKEMWGYRIRRDAKKSRTKQNAMGIRRDLQHHWR